MAVRLPNVRNSEVFLGSPARMSDFAVLPHLSRHPPAAASGKGRWKRASGVKNRFAKEFGCAGILGGFAKI